MRCWSTRCEWRAASRRPSRPDRRSGDQVGAVARAVPIVAGRVSRTSAPEGTGRARRCLLSS